MKIIREKLLENIARAEASARDTINRADAERESEAERITSEQLQVQKRAAAALRLLADFIDACQQNRVVVLRDAVQECLEDIRAGRGPMASDLRAIFPVKRTTRENAQIFDHLRAQSHQAVRDLASLRELRAILDAVPEGEAISTYGLKQLGYRGPIPFGV